MSHAGMQPVSGEAQEQGSGDYIVEGFQFTMGGDWILTVRATLPDGTQVQKNVQIDGVAGMSARTSAGARVGDEWQQYPHAAPSIASRASSGAISCARRCSAPSCAGVTRAAPCRRWSSSWRR